MKIGRESWKDSIYLDPLGAVLHVDPEVTMVPEALHSKVAFPVEWVGLPCCWLQEEALCHLTLARQHQHPAVDTQAMVEVRRRGLCLLM